MRKVIIISLLIILVLNIGIAHSHDDKIIHPEITRISILKSDIDAYLKDNLNLAKGVDAILPMYGQKTIIDWLKDGSTAEDALDDCRASNHFHDPTKAWSVAGMNDSPWFINLACSSWQPYYSAVTWATGYASPTEQRPSLGYNLNDEVRSANEWSKAYHYYYKALMAEKKSQREAHFAQMFLALGKVLHLIQDMSVPAHVRNDFRSHLNFSGVHILDLAGSWIWPPKAWFNNTFEYYVKAHSELVSKASASVPAFSNARVTDFWDRQTSQVPLGLAQITNAGYLSDSTIPNNDPAPEYRYSSPAINSSLYICEDYAPGSKKLRKYISRKACGTPSEARTEDHFAAVSVLNKPVLITRDYISTLRLWLDDNVHKTYAGELLPLAVGYSAAVLDYFFRGQLEVSFGEPQPQCVEATEESVLYDITVRNNSPDSLVESIDLRLYNADDERIGECIVPLNFGTTLPPGGSITGPCSMTRDVKSVVAVYRGGLGNGEETVIGKFKTGGWKWPKVCEEPDYFVFNLTRADGVPVTPELTPSFSVYNSSNEWINAQAIYIGDDGYPSVPGKWKVVIPEHYYIDPNGYWVSYSCLQSPVGVQYPGIYKTENKGQRSDLIQPGEYQDTIPYFKAERLGWSSDPRGHQSLDSIFLRYSVTSSIPYSISYVAYDLWFAPFASCAHATRPTATSGTVVVSGDDAGIFASGSTLPPPTRTDWIKQDAGSKFFTITVSAQVNSTTHSYDIPGATSPPFWAEEVCTPVYYQVRDRMYPGEELHIHMETSVYF